MADSDEQSSKLRPNSAPVVLPLNLSSSSEKSLNKITDKISSLSDTASTFDLLGALKTVANASSNQDAFAPLRVVLSSLDQIMKVHPFLAVAIIPFKAVMTLELKRRDNDRRILVLVTQMTDMMSHLCALPHTEVSSIQQNALQDVLLNVKDKVNECGNAIDVYYKNKLIVKIIKALSWQEKLEQFAQAFSDLKDLLKMRLLLVINSSVAETHVLASSSDHKIDEVLKLLRRRTDLEAELSEFLHSQDTHGGIMNAVKDDEFMQRLIRRFEGASDPGPGPSSASADSHGPELPRRGSYAGPESAWYSARRQNSTGSVYYRPSSFRDPMAQQMSAESVHYAGPLDEFSSRERGPQRHSSISQSAAWIGAVPRTTSGPGAVPAPPSSWNGHGMPPPPTGPDARPSATNIPNIRTTTATAANNPTSIGRAPIRTTVGWRQPDEDYLDYSGSVKPLLVEQYRTEIHYALTTELTVMLDRNEQMWTFKLEHFSGGIKRHIDAGTQRVIRAITDGPHVRIRHPQLREVWEKEKWRGSVGGMQFLQSVQDYMEDDPQMELAETRSEEWAAHFLTVPYRVPLLQEIDRDCSGFVSVAEANAFVDRKPFEMSLMLWFAYSAVAWTYEANECRKRIRDAWTKLADFLPTLPNIPDAIYDFEAYVGPEVDVLLVALRIFPRRIAEITEHTKLTDVVNRRLNERIDVLRTNLDKLDWEIDSLATLKAVAGDLPIETYLLPLLSLLISRFVEEVISTNATLPQRSIFAAKDTLAVILAAVDERVFHLIDCYPPESTWELSFGLYSQWQPREVPAEPFLPKFAPVDPQTEVEEGEGTEIGEEPPKVDTPLATVPVLVEEKAEEPRRGSSEATLPATNATSSESVISSTPTASIMQSVESAGADSHSETLSIESPILTQSPLHTPSHASAVFPSEEDARSLKGEHEALVESPVAKTEEGGHGDVDGAVDDEALDEEEEHVPIMDEQLAMAPLFFVEALYTYKAGEGTDMDLEVGDRIAVIATPESGWWIGKNLSEARDVPGRNTFPSNYVELLKEFD